MAVMAMVVLYKLSLSVLLHDAEAMYALMQPCEPALT